MSAEGPSERHRRSRSRRSRRDGDSTARSSPFDRFARWIAHYAGYPGAFTAAVVVIAVWLVAGPLFGFSNTWQLVINTATTIVTFLMVFVIQNTQNRDGAAIQIKLDELVRAVEGAHNGLLDLEELNEVELERFRKKYLELAAEARKQIRQHSDTGTPDVELS